MIIDIVTGIIVCYGLYQGYSNGLIKTVFSTLSLIIAVVAALKLSPIVINTFQDLTNLNPAISFVIGFVLTFVLSMVIVRFIGNKLDSLFKTMQLGTVNKVFGGLILGTLYLIFISYLILLIDKVDLLSDNQRLTSYTYPIHKTIPQITQDLAQSLRPMFQEFWDSLMATMDEIKKIGENAQGG